MGPLKKVNAEAPGSLLMLTEPMRGHAGLVAGRFMKAFGSKNRVAWDPFGPDAMLTANAAVYGVRDLPEHDFANARYVLSFSGDFLETGISPVHYAREYGRMRGDARRSGEGHPLRAPALDDRGRRRPVPSMRPGTEGFVALGIAHVMVRDRLTAASSTAGRLSDDLGAWSPRRSRRRPGSTRTISPRRRRNSRGTSPAWRSRGRGPRPAPAGRSIAPPWRS